MCVDTKTLPCPTSSLILGNQFPDQCLEMEIDRGRIELVALQAASRFGGGMVVLAGGGVPQSQDQPVALRYVPRQFSVGTQALGQIDDPVAWDDRVMGQRTELSRLRRKMPRLKGRLAADARDPCPATRSRHRQYGNVADSNL